MTLTDKLLHAIEGGDIEADADGPEIVLLIEGQESSRANSNMETEVWDTSHHRQSI